MSYNIDFTLTPVFNNVHMRAADVRRLQAQKSRLPETHFLEDLDVEGLSPDAYVRLPNLYWCGEGSGRAEDFFVTQVAPCVMGEVDGIFVWEGGGSFSGFRIRDGMLTQHTVVHALGEEINDWCCTSQTCQDNGGILNS